MKIEATEVCNASIHELVSSPFSTDWSADNQISVITQKGVHIFELQPNPLCTYPTAKFKRSFVYPTDYLPCQSFIPQTQKLLNEYDREDFYRLMFEEAITPKLAEKHDHTVKIIAVEWSPIKLVEPLKCLLSILTSAGAIDLAIKINKNWFSICNLSTLWWRTIREEIKFDGENLLTNPPTAETFRKSLRRLIGTAIAWSPIYQTDWDAFSYFVTAYRSGDLVIWKVKRVPELGMLVVPTIVCRTQIEVKARISKLLWIHLRDGKYLLIVGFCDGRVYGLKLALMKDILTKTDMEKYEDLPDGMNVTYMREFSRNSEEISLVIVKNYFFIVMTVNTEGKFVRQLHLQVLGYAISGLALTGKNTAIVTTQDSRLYWITLDEKGLSSERISHDMKTASVQFLGLANSPSGFTFTNVTSPNCLYDHLVNRDPSTIHLFNLKHEKHDSWSALKNIKDNFSTHWDCLESIRIKAAKEENPEAHIPVVPDISELSSVDQLRVIMWLTLVTDVLKKKKSLKKIDNVIGTVSEAQPLIYIYSASSHIIKLATLDTLTEDMRRSVHFLSTFMEAFVRDNEGKKCKTSNAALENAKKAIKIASDMDPIKIEVCNICEEVLEDLPWNTSSCPNGHTLPRCALTLLQVTCLQYRNCPACGRIYHPSLDVIYDEVRCIYCVIPIQYDTRLGVDDYVNKKCKNLSIKPIQDTAPVSTTNDTNSTDEKENKNLIVK